MRGLHVASQRHRAQWIAADSLEVFDGDAVGVKLIASCTDQNSTVWESSTRSLSGSGANSAPTRSIGGRFIESDASQPLTVAPLKISFVPSSVSTVPLGAANQEGKLERRAQPQPRHDAIDRTQVKGRRDGEGLRHDQRVVVGCSGWHITCGQPLSISRERKYTTISCGPMPSCRRSDSRLKLATRFSTASTVERLSDPSCRPSRA